MFGRGDGGFDVPIQHDLGLNPNPIALATADLNIDGLPDLVTIYKDPNCQAGVCRFGSTLLGDGTGAFAQQDFNFNFGNRLTPSMRALGVAATERASGIPDVPTYAEQGIKDQDADTITGLVAPAGTPKAIVDLLHREIAKAVAQPDVKERLMALGFKPVANTPDEFAARITLEIEKWGKVVRDAKLRIE